MSEQRYQGWENWETWVVSLWLNNISLEVQKEAQHIVCSNEYEYHHQMIDALEEYVGDLVDAGTITDRFSNHRVNWYEVAEGQIIEPGYREGYDEDHIKALEQWLEEMK